MVNTEIIKNGITSLPKDVQDEILKLVEKEEVAQFEAAEKEKLKADEAKLMKYLASVGIAPNTESFDPKIKFAAGEHDGIKLWHSDNFSKYMFKPATIVGNMPAQNFTSHENKRNAYDKDIRAEIGEQVITPDQLWVAWNDLIFKQPKGQTGTLKTNGYANVWYVMCYDGIVRAVDCYWLAGFGRWYLYCFALDDVDWNDEHQFFVSDDTVKS